MKIILQEYYDWFVFLISKFSFLSKVWLILVIFCSYLCICTSVLLFRKAAVNWKDRNVRLGLWNVRNNSIWDNSQDMLSSLQQWSCKSNVQTTRRKVVRNFNTYFDIYEISNNSTLSSSIDHILFQTLVFEPHTLSMERLQYNIYTNKACM